MFFNDHCDFYARCLISGQGENIHRVQRSRKNRINFTNSDEGDGTCFFLPLEINMYLLKKNALLNRTFFRPSIIRIINKQIPIHLAVAEPFTVRRTFTYNGRSTAADKSDNIFFH